MKIQPSPAIVNQAVLSLAIKIRCRPPLNSKAPSLAWETHCLTSPPMSPPLSSRSTWKTVHCEPCKCPSSVLASRFGLRLNNAILAEEAHVPLYEELVRDFAVSFSAAFLVVLLHGECL